MPDIALEALPVLPTYIAFNNINKDVNKAIARTAKQPDVQRETEYYLSKIESIKTVEDFLKNERVYRYAMKAYGLEDMIYAKGMMKKILEGGTSAPNSLANRMNDARFKAFAKAFDFATFKTSATVREAAKSETTAAFFRMQLEKSAGEENEGVRLALYFQRKASSVTNEYGILADKALLKVFQTAYGITPLSSNQSIEAQAATIKKNIDIKDLQDPAKVNTIIKRFTAKYDMANAEANAASNPILSLFNGSSGSVGLSPDLYNSIFNLGLKGR